MDDLTREQRTKNMRNIRSCDTSIETKLRKALWKEGFRYRKNDRRLPGSPDIVLPKYHTVIFIHGCFWHKHDCGRFRWPKTNVDYWEKKIRRNIERDIEVKTQLEEMNWNVITVWECQLKNKYFEATLDTIKKELMYGD